jgi:hypothetical protein
MEKEQITFKETIVSCSDGSQILEGLWYNKEVAIKSMPRKNEEKAKIGIEAYRLLKRRQLFSFYFLSFNFGLT